MRMRSYTLHLPPEARPGEAEALDRAVIVPDGFSWPAFAYTVLWFLFHRLWIAALIVLAGLAALAVGGYALGLTRAAGTGIALLASVLIGFERGGGTSARPLARSGEPAAAPAPALPGRPGAARRAGDRPVPRPRRRAVTAWIQA